MIYIYLTANDDRNYQSFSIMTATVEDIKSCTTVNSADSDPLQVRHRGHVGRTEQKMCLTSCSAALADRRELPLAVGGGIENEAVKLETFCFP